MQVRCNRRRGAALAEFGPVLWMFLIMFVIPFLDLISYGSAAGTVMYISTFGARACAGAQTFSEAKTAASNLETQMLPFLRFAIAKPSNGAATGLSITVNVQTISPSVSIPGSPFASPGSIPNQPASDPTNPTTPTYNTSNCVYQYLVSCSYDIMPLFNFSALPFLHDVPALGHAATFNYTATAAVEHPEGLNQ